MCGSGHLHSFFLYLVLSFCIRFPFSLHTLEVSLSLSLSLARSCHSHFISPQQTPAYLVIVLHVHEAAEFPTQTPMSTAALKQSVRRVQLQYMRHWAREHPADVFSESEQICGVLHDYIGRCFGEVSTVAAHTPPCHHQIQATRCQRGRGTLFVCVYLPLYYEVDLRPLMRRLWARESSPLPAARGRDVCVMVPIVLDVAAAEKAGLLLQHSRTADVGGAGSVQSHAHQTPFPPHHDDFDPAALAHAMAFVEVRDEADLDASFEKSGKYGLIELKRSLFHRFFRHHSDASPIGMPNASDQTSEASDHRVAAPGPRRLLLCDDWETMFPMFPRPPGLIQWRDNHEHQNAAQKEAATSVPLGALSDGQLVVVAPGVRFSTSTGARLGKGGGFYDRFLCYHRSQAYLCGAADDANTAPSTDREATRAGDSCGGSSDFLHVIGVGFRNQVTPSSPVGGGTGANAVAPLPRGDSEVTDLPVPFDPSSDMAVDAVATPDGIFSCLANKATLTK